MHAILFIPGVHASIIATHTCVLQGRVLLSKLTADDEWTKVYAVSRRPLHFEHERLQHIALDLKDKNKVTESLKSEKVSGVTHVFHTAFAGDMTNTDRGVAQMLDHLIDGLEANGESLHHVYFTTGLKYYGEQFFAQSEIVDYWLHCHCPLLVMSHCFLLLSLHSACPTFSIFF